MSELPLNCTPTRKVRALPGTQGFDRVGMGLPNGAPFSKGGPSERQIALIGSGAEMPHTGS